MIPPGKTTLYRMQLAAQNEAERIEISQDGGITLGWQKEPRPDQVQLRDDFAGIVRLVDAILSDDALRGRVEDAMKRPRLATQGASKEKDMEIVPVDEEVEPA